MAYAAVASLSQTIDIILDYHQDSISPQFTQKITSVYDHIIFLQSFLEDFPDEAMTLEERLREITDNAEDIIELLLSDSLMESSVGSSKSKFKNDLDELERVAEEIESIAKGVKGRHREAADGFNEGLMQIISRLFGGSSVLEIIPIVGVGGIGKTTLARQVYNHPSVVNHFEIRAWATVSQNYTWRGIISSLLGSMIELKAENISSSEDELFESVHEILSGRRYLIVLDDVWSEKVWQRFKFICHDNWNGSRIIITTRLSNLASRVAYSSHVHEMSLMDVDRSWNLLRQKIFKGGACPPNLECTGKMIARSCRLPLAVEVVSGILAADLTQPAWEDVAENVANCEDDDDDQHLRRILHLSYTYMPHHLRPCFLYLGILPEDHEIRVSKLIKLWVAEGFLHQSAWSKSFEETGAEYLEDLVNRNLVLVIKRKSNGRIKSFSIHDLIRDLCVRQAYADNFYLHVRRFPPPADATKLQRRVSIFDNDDDFLGNLLDGSAMRTIICLEGNHESVCWLKYFRLLRILQLSTTSTCEFSNDQDLPREIFKLLHLRYLAFSYPFRIPKAIANLKNLQTLILRSSKHRRQIIKLPVEIWRMPELRHVVVLSCELPTQEEEEEEEEEVTTSSPPLSHLQTLYKALDLIYSARAFKMIRNLKELVVKKKQAIPRPPLVNLQTLSKAVDLICSRETLNMIPNLKKLGIFYTRWRDPEEDYQLHNLVHLQKLEILKIETYNLLEEQRRISLAFYPTLKKLSLSGLRLPWDDMKVVGSLPNLQVLKLRDHACVGCIWETDEGRFVGLKFLLIERSDLELWISESSHFPRLNCLVLHNCWRLKQVPTDIGEIPTLELLEVDRWNKPLLYSLEQIQENRTNSGNDSFQVCVV